MKNFEKYKDELTKLILVHIPCSFRRVHLHNINCTGVECGDCHKKLNQWLLEEYKEPVKLSHDEYVILKNLPSEYKYISRDGNGWVETYEYEPTKEKYVWSNDGEGLVGDLFVFSNLFQFIKFEDEEPYNIQELVENYEKEHKDV